MLIKREYKEMKKLYTIDLDNGYLMSIISAKSLRIAQQYAQHEYGRLRHPKIVESTQDDIINFKSMNGYIKEI